MDRDDSEKGLGAGEARIEEKMVDSSRNTTEKFIFWICCICFTYGTSYSFINMEERR